MEIERTVKTIRERLIERFVRAREMVGETWRNQLAASDTHFNTLSGVRDMNQAASATNYPERINSDRLERVVLALEKLAEIQNGPVV